MSVVAEVKDTIVEAKKKYDKEKYISVLENQIKVLQQEIERMNTKIALLEEDRFILNSDHLELFKLFKDNNYRCYKKDLINYSKKNIDLEIALSELIEHGYFEYPRAYAIGSEISLYVPEDKKIELLQALKKSNIE